MANPPEPSTLLLDGLQVGDHGAFDLSTESEILVTMV